MTLSAKLCERKVERRGGKAVISLLLGLATALLAPIDAHAQQESSRLVYDSAKLAMSGREPRDDAEVDRLLAYAGMKRNASGAWLFADQDGQVVVTAEFGLHVFTVGYVPANEPALSAEVLAALGRSAKAVSFRGPDEMHFVFEVFGEGMQARAKKQAQEEVVIRISDGRWIDTRTIVHFEQ